ncbi:hypothetical protein SAMN05216262_11313 [Colwellia chukchiensis]|uniref:Uncharacterized protein n=1 Tax=Colwellia chukchiensis TaxID=641665 RepID=A0A1H7QY71_9GAMM|nr:hypothetical protein [Colwellia chukchiensis]SEL52950.1 hypothetical protein SAMN05216262_11313 [Colwellia chukchiensis]
MKMSFIPMIMLSLLSLTWTINAHADGLADLQQALAKLNGSAPVTAMLDVSFSETRGDGKDKKVKTGAITSHLFENNMGLNISYSKNVLQQIAQENQTKISNKNADTPALNGAEILSASSLIPILSSAQSILDIISQGDFIGENYIDYQDKPTRVLNFELPLESFIEDKKIRGYVRKFNGSYQVLINEDGVPIETRMRYNGKGSAYIFFSLSAESEITSQYTVTGGRLVRINKTVASHSSSTFSDRTYRGTWQLAIL